METMYHSKKIICALLVATALCCGCSQRDDMVGDVQETVQSQEAMVTFRLQTNATTLPGTRSAEDSYTHVQGTADEYKVTTARVYLFDAPTKLFAKTVVLTGLKRQGSDANGNIVYEAERVAVPQGTYDIFVTANTDRVLTTTTEEAFLADIDSTTYVKAQIDDISNGVVMTNRASANLATVIRNSQSGNNENVVGVTLERVLARIDIAKSREAFELTDDNGRKYASVTLDGHYIVNLPKYYYSFRHTAVLTTLEKPQWNVNEHFGNVNDVNGYVIDPDFFKKTIDASQFSNDDKYYEHFVTDQTNPEGISWTAFKPVAETPQYNTAYCLENCALQPAQKNGYSTGVIFRARMEPNNNVYRLAADGELTLVTDKKDYPEVLYYWNYNFYDSADALSKAVGGTVTGQNLDVYRAQKFEKSDDGYRCYYRYWIRHLDNYKNTTMGVMEFGVVRNNLYRLLIANVSGLGSGEGETTIDPDTPDEGETYLKVVLNVKPWIVRDLTDIVL